MRNYTPKPCPNNPGAIVCMDDTKCSRCGWNPEVERARKEERKKPEKGEHE